MFVKKVNIGDDQGKSIREQVVAHVARFSLASLIGGIGTFFNNYFAALLLGPGVWGMWQGAKLMLLYGGKLHFGIRHGMHRELPILRGKEEPGQQAAITDVTFTFNFIIASVVSLGILLSSFVIAMGSELKLSLQFISAMIFLQYLNSFYGLLFRANNEFGIVSRVALLNGLGSVFSIALVFSLGLLGFLGGQVLRLLVATTYSWRRSSYAIHWCWDNRVLRGLILVGFPIMLMGFANTVFTTIDRLLILRFLDAKSLGCYSLANLIFAPLLMIFTASNSVMYPRSAERYGETSDPRSLRRYITVPMENLATAIPILVGAIYIALPLLVKLFLPEYGGGVVATRILLLGLFLHAIAGMAGNVLLAMNKQILCLEVLLGTTVLNFGLSYAGLRLGYGIEGVAAATSFAYFVFFLTSSIMAMRYTEASYRESSRLVAKVLGPAFYTIAIVLSISALLPVTSGAPGRMILRTIISEAALVVCSSYSIYKTIRHNGMIDMLRGRSGLKAGEM